MPKTIKLATNLNCLADPCFIVEKDGALYLAVAVLEYDQAQAGGNPAKDEGVANVRRLYTEGCQNRTLRACELTSEGTLPPPTEGMRPGGSTGQGSGGSSPGGGDLSGPSGPGAPPPPPPPPPGPPDPPPPPLDPPPGIQTEPPGLQTSP